MPDDETGSSRKPRGSRKPSSAAFADDWPDVAPAAPAEATTDTPVEPVPQQRIARAIARAGLCSRRDAENWILEGRVSVNGEVLTSPARDVGPDDRVEVDGAPLPEPEKTRLFLFHKPRGLVTSDHDPEGRPTVANFLRENWPQGPRVVTIGRLDINTEGLLLLTNDGGLARALELPKTGWLRRYRVRAKGETDQSKLDALADGIVLDEVEYAGIEAKLDRVQGANCWLTMGLREGKNREIKRVLEHLGLEVNRLIRLSFGPFQMLDLPEGHVEEVRTRVLRDQLGATLAAEAGVDFGDAPTPAAAIATQATAPKRDAKGKPSGAGKITLDPARSRAKRSGVGDPRPQQSRALERRDGERPMRRGTAATTPAEHNNKRPRRHVSTLRTTEAEITRKGPRRRIERTDTRDRNDRTVAVERKVSAQPARSLSPSAQGKRARIARSGAPRRQGGDDAPRGMSSRSSPGVDRGVKRDEKTARRPESGTRREGGATRGSGKPSYGRDRGVDGAAPRRELRAEGSGDRRLTRSASPFGANRGRPDAARPTATREAGRGGGGSARGEATRQGRGGDRAGGSRRDSDTSAASRKTAGRPFRGGTASDRSAPGAKASASSPRSSGTRAAGDRDPRRRSPGGRFAGGGGGKGRAPTGGKPPRGGGGAKRPKR